MAVILWLKKPLEGKKINLLKNGEFDIILCEPQPETNECKINVGQEIRLRGALSTRKDNIAYCVDESMMGSTEFLQMAADLAGEDDFLNLFDHPELDLPAEAPEPPAAA